MPLLLGSLLVSVYLVTRPTPNNTLTSASTQQPTATPTPFAEIVPTWFPSVHKDQKITDTETTTPAPEPTLSERQLVDLRNGVKKLKGRLPPEAIQELLRLINTL